MQVNPTTRIQKATHIRAGDLSLYALIRTFNQETNALVRLKAANSWIFSGWSSSGRWRDLSQLLTYWGPKKSDTDALEILNTARVGEPVARSSVTELIEAYLLSQLDKETASRLRGTIDNKISSDISVSTFVDGESETAWGGGLGLASAQRLGERIYKQASLNDAEINSLHLLLTEAPLQFGYWGPFKTALKYLDPEALPGEFGIALARLSSHEDSASASAEIEDLRWMSAFMEVPTNETRQYMAKRMRRQLAKVGESNPSLYTLIAARMLQCWDQALEPTSYLPAYVIGGDRTVLSDNGRLVALPLDQSSRRDAHPAAWDSQREELRHLLPQIKNSVETFTFASQVLLATGEPLPELKASQLCLALNSSDPRLATRALKLIPQLPEQWKNLSSKHWGMFFRQTDKDVIKDTLGSLTHTSLPNALSGVEDLLASSEKYCLLNATEQHRVQLVSEFYIAAITAPEANVHFYPDSDAIAAALLSLGCSLNMENRSELWESRLSQLDSQALMKAYQQLAIVPSAPTGNLDVLERALIQSENYDYQLYQLALQAMETPASRAISLGWKLFDRCVYAEHFITQLWRRLNKSDAPNGFTSEEWQGRRLELLGGLLARSEDLSDKISELLRSDTWTLNSATVANLLVASTECLRAIWAALASDDLEESIELKTMLQEQESVILAIGDLLQAEDLSGASQLQQDLLLNYVNKRERVNLDCTFAIAAVALGEPKLQQACLEQLENSNNLQKYWLQLAELGLPLPLRTVRLYLNELETTSAFTDAVLACVDSIVPMVRDLGLELIGSHPEQIDQDRLWLALSESDDPVIQARVAEESLQRTWAGGQGLADFDRRLLVSRRSNRRAKIQVQRRLSAEQLLAPERRAALLDLARGANARDREWALRQIAELTLQGVPFDGVALRPVTTTDNAGVQN